MACLCLQLAQLRPARKHTGSPVTGAMQTKYARHDFFLPIFGIFRLFGSCKFLTASVEFIEFIGKPIGREKCLLKLNSIQGRAGLVFWSRLSDGQWALLTVMMSDVPVFYDCEASCIGGLPIEIGWAFIDLCNGRNPIGKPSGQTSLALGYAAGAAVPFQIIRQSTAQWRASASARCIFGEMRSAFSGKSLNGLSTVSQRDFRFSGIECR